MVVVAVALDHITPPCGWLCSCNNMPPRVLFLTKQTEICSYNPTWLIFFFFFIFYFFKFYTWRNCIWTALTQRPDFEEFKSMWGTLDRALFSDKHRRKVGFDLWNLISLALCCQKTLWSSIRRPAWEFPPDKEHMKPWRKTHTRFSFMHLFIFLCTLILSYRDTQAHTAVE